ncbi:unnamed protein product [Urochloa humidicola]
MGDTSEATLDDLKKLMGDLKTKVTAVEGEISSLRVDQGRLHVAVNNVQSDRLAFAESSHSGAKDKGVIGGPMLAAVQAVPHKLRFPKFDGSTDLIAWLHRCDQFFRAARTLDDEKVWLASFYMDNAAQQWYYCLERNQGVPTRERFTELVNRRFGPPARSNPLGELIKLQRVGTIAEY